MMPGALRDLGASVTCLQLLQLLQLLLLLLLLQLLLPAGAEQPRPRAWDEDRRQLEAVKRSILDRLGMAAPPAPRPPPDPDSVRRAQRLHEQRVAELQRNRSRGREEDEGAAAATRWHRLTLTLQRLPDPPRGEWDPHGDQDPHGPHRYRLVVSRTEDFHRRLWVLRAQLQLFKQSLGSLARPRVSIYAPGGPGRALRLLQTREVDARSGRLDLTMPVRRWAASHDAELHLELLLPADAAALLPGTEPRSVGLEVETRAGAGRGARQRRGLEEECGKSEGKCCRRSLKVSFQDIGWDDWVLAPSSYYMRFCEGSCPHNYKPASMHAQIKARVHALSRAAPAPCCVPAAYDPMVLMHYDSEGRLVSTVFEDMLVTRCHCA